MSENFNLENSHGRPKSESENIQKLFDRLAPTYEGLIERTGYQGLKIVKDMYEKNKIYTGTILDVGCGTGKLKDYLGDKFEYIGIDLSAKVLEEAKKKGFDIHAGKLEEELRNFTDKSIDHIVCVGVSGFIKNFDELVNEFFRVARETVLFSIEYVPGRQIADSKIYRQIQLYNHSKLPDANFTEVQRDVPFWQSDTGSVPADIYFRKISG